MNNFTKSKTNLILAESRNSKFYEKASEKVKGQNKSVK